MKLLKMLSLIIMLFMLAVFLFACGDNKEQPKSEIKNTVTNEDYPKEIIALAKLEASNLHQTLSILDQVTFNYNRWEQGSITREHLAEQLAPLYPKIKTIQDSYLQFRKDTNFAKTAAVNHEAYQKGLYQGDMIRKRIMHIIQDVSVGYPAAQGVFSVDGPKVDDYSIKQSFENNIHSNIDKRVAKLQAILAEFDSKGLLK